ncbi:hypothetical protein AVEN_23661-1 [Araneus ventricosus]|uniref:Uncharacterized protein n=1 Tax=Araneus ventricosus TaxID=182803 RepID=A0A4Y2BJ37_ARAVE|nr:hypothetical protein AVEN_23661-1 [Araneus ventricosus]
MMSWTPRPSFPPETRERTYDSNRFNIHQPAHKMESGLDPRSVNFQRQDFATRSSRPQHKLKGLIFAFLRTNLEICLSDRILAHQPIEVTSTRSRKEVLGGTGSSVWNSPLSTRSTLSRYAGLRLITNRSGVRVLPTGRHVMPEWRSLSAQQRGHDLLYRGGA